MNIRTAFSFSFGLVLLAALCTACGGALVPSDEGDDSGTGGSTSDGAGQDGGVGGSGNAPGAGGGAGGSVPTTGGAPGTGGDDPMGTGGEPPQCCLAEASCGEGDLEVESESDCPIGGECYSSTTCCSTVWCMKQQPLCDASPTCAADETQVATCLEGRVCVKRVLCGDVITCQKVESFCDLGQQPNREYVGQGSECIDVDLACPEHTTPFDEPCGCGCEQPSSCPEYVDCEPGGELDPLCESNECPFTTRAL